MAEEIVITEKNDGRKTIAIVCACLSIACFVVHYVLLKGTCDPDAGQVYEYCVKGSAANYWVETFIVQLGNAGLVFTLLWYFGWPMLQNMIADRKVSIERDITASRDIKDAAEATYKEAMKKSENLSEEKVTIRKSYEASAASESVRIVEEAKAQAERMKADADAAFELQASVTKRHFEQQVMDDALAKARDEIARRLASDGALRDKLIEQSIATLEL